MAQVYPDPERGREAVRYRRDTAIAPYQNGTGAIPRCH